MCNFALDISLQMIQKRYFFDSPMVLHRGNETKFLFGFFGSFLGKIEKPLKLHSSLELSYPNWDINQQLV